MKSLDPTLSSHGPYLYPPPNFLIWKVERVIQWWYFAIFASAICLPIFAEYFKDKLQTLWHFISKCFSMHLIMWAFSTESQITLPRPRKNFKCPSIFCYSLHIQFSPNVWKLFYGYFLQSRPKQHSGIAFHCNVSSVSLNLELYPPPIPPRFGVSKRPDQFCCSMF